MGNLVLAALDVVLHELLLENFPRQKLCCIFAKVDEGTALRPARRMRQLFIDLLEELFSTLGVVLVLQDLGEALARCFLDFLVTLPYEVKEDGYYVDVDLRHVEKVDSLDQVVY